jgi:hypothetical protein
LPPRARRSCCCCHRQPTMWPQPQTGSRPSRRGCSCSKEEGLAELPGILKYHNMTTSNV